MTESASEKASLKHKQTGIENFVGSLMSSAKMMSLYQPGHPTILQIAERTNNLLMNALGQETTIVIDLKGKSASVGDMELSETKDISLFGVTLHTLGIGQVLFTNRLTKEGMYEFLKVLIAKADENKSLTALQQEIQKLRIDGLQMSFVLSFVATGETEVTEQMPGQLTEEQIAAFIRTETLPDFLLLLLKQNEPLNGKDAETLTLLLDNTLHREVSLEQFQQSMPWSSYDPRIRACWDSFMQKQQWEPKQKSSAGSRSGTGNRQKWDRKTLVTQISLFRNSDLETLQSRQIYEKAEAVQYCLGAVHSVINVPSSQVQADWALIAYGRMLTELGHDGNIGKLLDEFKQWQIPAASGEPNPYFNTVVRMIQEKVLSVNLAENVIVYMSNREEKTEAFTELENFLPFLGLNAVPLFIEELRKLSDQKERRKLCSLLTTMSKRLEDVSPLVTALSDPDWFIVRNIIMILGEINFPGTSKSLVPLLHHKHERVREECIRSLGKIGDDSAIDALGTFILKWDKPEEIAVAITTLSLLVHPGIDKKLIEAFNQINHYATRIAIVTALSRVCTQSSLKFLESVSKRSFIELITGRNKSLRKTASESLEQVKKGVPA